jgi:hypothetical protein
MTPQDYQHESQSDGPPPGLIIIFAATFVLGLAVTVLLPFLI